MSGQAGPAPNSAGGIGGLLALSDQRASINSPTNYFYHSDANGNVTLLLNKKNEVAARYLYDPFGNLLAKSGPMADWASPGLMDTLEAWGMGVV